MSNDHFTETTSQGWFSRIGGAFAGVLVGVIMIVVCVGVLAWNENRAVRTERALNEGAGLVATVASTAIDPANEGRLVHATGETTVTEPLVDEEFGVTATGVRLVRQPEMYQWREDTKSETRQKLGGGEDTVTTYDYVRVWSSSAIDSSAFERPQGHENPEFEIEAASITAQDARLGAFELNDDIIEQIGGARAVRLDETQQQGVTDTVGEGVIVSPTTLYLGEHPEAPEIGDVRVSYEVTPTSEISVVAAQSGDGFAPYRARNGEPVLLVADGAVAASEMFASAQDANRMILWIVRAAGIVFLIVGFGLILNPLKVLADVVPLFGSIVGMGTGLIAFVLGTLVGTVTIAVAWFAVRPLLSLVILAIGGAVAFAFWRFGRRSLKKARATEPTAA